MEQDSSVELVVVPPTKDLGGFEVRRALPSKVRRLVGPFVFFDQMGPALLQPGRGLDVRPHPHIGLATVTYLFSGEILHRDSLGTVQPIRPGAVNWMTAGRGIVHSERTPPDVRAAGGPLWGIQAWVALPKRDEETAPAFVHHPAEALPLVEDGGVSLRLIAGAGFGVRAPVEVFSELVYADVTLAAGARLQVPRDYEERALYVVDGSVAIAGDDTFEKERLVVLRPGAEIVASAEGGPARLMLFGGAPMDGPRHIHWNFVSSSVERLRQARDDWQAMRMGTIPGDDREFIPLPDWPLPREEAVHYP